MLTVRLQPYDLQHYRFVQSPALDLAIALRSVMAENSNQRTAQPARKIIASMSMADFRLIATAVRRSYVADFIAPTDLPPGTDLPEALEHSRSKGDWGIAKELCLADKISALPGQSERRLVGNALENPTRYMSSVCSVLNRLWKSGLCDNWHRSRHFFDREIEVRGRLIAEVGPFQALGLMLSRIGGTMSGQLLTLSRPFTHEHISPGLGLLLLPCPFLNGNNLVNFTSTSPTSLTYSVEWPADTVPVSGSRGALGKIVGNTRARLLEALAKRTTTTELAHILGCTPAAVSQHIHVLRETQLVESKRSGRQVFHRLSGFGHRLLLLMR